MAGLLRKQYQWIFGLAALTVWVSSGWPLLERLVSGETIRGATVPQAWLMPFLLFGAAVFAAMTLKLRPIFYCALLAMQVAAVLTMAIIVPWAGMSEFLIITAWQVATLTTPAKALGWIGFQTLAVIATLAHALSPDLCWVLAESLALQLVLFLTAQALRREAVTARELSETNQELRAAQAVIADSVRNAERLRISRELHDAWGHELTALRLQLEIASHVSDAADASEHVMKAKGLSSDLLTKVRDVVSTLREAELCDLKEALERLAKSVPAPVIHVDIAAGVHVSSEQAHALMRCAQEAVTNAIKHAHASNLWLQVSREGEGVRLVARDDGSADHAASAPGSGLLGMRERIELLGGKLAVGRGRNNGFTVDAWLPSAAPQPA